jgi:hypothetical protein
MLIHEFGLGRVIAQQWIGRKCCRIGIGVAYSEGRGTLFFVAFSSVQRKVRFIVSCPLCIVYLCISGWLRQCTTSRKVAGSISNDVVAKFD